MFATADAALPTLTSRNSRLSVGSTASPRPVRRRVTVSASISADLASQVRDVFAGLLATSGNGVENLRLYAASLPRLVTSSPPLLVQERFDELLAGADHAASSLPLLFAGVQVDTTAATALAGVAGVAALAAIVAAASSPAVMTTLPTVYDPAASAAFFNARPGLVTSRQVGLLREVAAFVFALLADKAGGVLDLNSAKRAAQLRELIVRQGAAFIKVGQAVAIRPDVLPPAYLTEFAKLLDQVPPFEAVAAKEALRTALASSGTTPEAAFLDAASAFEVPVAAASIGQVYKATLTDGTEVAVKVQRPDILESVSRDLHIIRTFALSLASLPLPSIAKQSASFVEVLDTAAYKFLQELDYTLEASNSIQFEALMGASSSIRGAIKEWVTGTKLNDLPRDTAEGKETCKRLVKTLLLSYMVQLLETGYLHADPHPGNFLLLDDGRVAILDYGMMTEITSDQRIAFLEYMAHLTSKQYDKTIDDLVNLGFVPAELANDPEKRRVVAPAIASTLQVLYGTGGGLSGAKMEALASQSRIAALSEELKAISRAYPVSLPPYFVLILRAFGTLEGLGLGVDRDFAILDECFPLVARRLLTDDSPRVRAALKTFAYGDSDRLSVERVEAVTDGFRTFSATMDAAGRQPVSLTTRSTPAAPVLDAATSEVLSILFKPEGSFLQTLLLEEAVRSIDALSRDAVVSVWSAAQRAVAPAAAPVSRLLGPAALLIPGFPLLALAAAGPPIRLSQEDVEQLAILRKLASVALPLAPPAQAALSPSAPIDVAAIAEAGRRVSQLLPAVRPGLLAAGERLGRMLAQRVLQRMSQDLSLASTIFTPTGR